MAEKSLHKSLSFIDIFAVASGAMISSGLFILPGLAYARVGPAVIISYLLAGLLSATGMLSITELVTAMPKAGGDYFVINRSLGPGVGTISGLISWFSLSLKGSFALVGMAAFTQLIPMLKDWDITIIAIILCVLFLVLNFKGVKEAGRAQVMLVMGLLVLLLVYVVQGLPKVQATALEPFVPEGPGSIFSTAGFVFVSYGGLLSIVSVAEEVKDPRKDIPRGMISSLFVVCLLYSFVVLVTVGVMDSAALSESLTPISDGAAVFMGRGGRIILSIAAILAFISTANAGIMSASRYPYALSLDKLLPEGLTRIHHRFRTPYLAILMTGIFMIVSLFLELDVLVQAASTVLILMNILVCFAVIIIRQSKLQNYRPTFRAPFYPWVQIVGIMGFIYVVFSMGTLAILMSFALILVGLIIYWLYGRKNYNREYALMHLLKPMTQQEGSSNVLESELKEIVRSRDLLIKDRFDHIVEEAIVADLEPMSMEKLFELASRKIGEKNNIPYEEIYHALIEREKIEHTAISTKVAIPHALIEREGIFDMMVVRCHEGIYFSESSPKVSCIFICVGSQNERNFYLRTLASIAQIVSHKDFFKRWKMARNSEILRDIILLADRKRH